MNFPRAVLLDMDGTLTEPMLDFPRIKREMGIGDQSILEALATMDDFQRAAAEAVLLRHEEAAATRSRLNPGCQELLTWLSALRVSTAIVTRNSIESVRTVLERHSLQVDCVVSRTDARPKPHPAGLHHACGRFGVAPGDAWMVGDGQYDIEAGAAAGVPTVWISHGRERTFATAPWRTVQNLHELADILRACGPPRA